MCNFNSVLMGWFVKYMIYLLCIFVTVLNQHNTLYSGDEDGVLHPRQCYYAFPNDSY